MFALFFPATVFWQLGFFPEFVLIIKTNLELRQKHHYLDITS